MNKRKVIYSILKEIDKGNEPNYTDYGITKEEFGEIIDMMASDNLISNATVSRGGIGNKVAFIHLKHTKITMPGLKYLEDNNAWSKTYKVLTEIREWIK